MANLYHADQLTISINVALFLQMIGLLFAIIADRYLSKGQKKLLLTVDLILSALVIQNQLQSFPDMLSFVPYKFQQIFISICGYILRPVVIMLFIRLLDSENRFRPLWGMVIVNALIYLSAFFTNIAFTHSESGAFERGPLGYTCHIICFVLLIWHNFQIINKYVKVRRREILIPIFFTIVIIISVFVDFKLFYVPVSFLTVSMVVSVIYYYIWLHLQFVREHEDSLRAQQRIQIMISQIQPHFLYNTLSTIQSLCLSDPEKAVEVLEKFGTYLRQNLESLNQSSLIPFSKELEHTQVYTDIEKVRFPSITIDYDIQDKDFRVPALTVQPLVENAIRHGVRIRKNGIIKVTSRREEDYHVIVIEDNGKGFDVSTLGSTDSENETHFGIRNVRNRIADQCGGLVTISSRPDEGTTIIISIPVEREGNI